MGILCLTVGILMVVVGGVGVVKSPPGLKAAAYYLVGELGCFPLVLGIFLTEMGKTILRRMGLIVP